MASAASWSLENSTKPMAALVFVDRMRHDMYPGIFLKAAGRAGDPKKSEGIQNPLNRGPRSWDGDWPNIRATVPGPIQTSKNWGTTLFTAISLCSQSPRI